VLNSVLIDTGPILALFDKDDNRHHEVMSFFDGKKFKFVTTTAVVTEVTHMLDFSVDIQILFFQWILKEGVVLHDIGPTDIGRIVELTKKYRDMPMDFADATLVIVAERTGIRKIISIDSDFNVYRLPGKVMIENIFC